MGVYNEHILPRLTEWILDQPAIERRRAETMGALEGEIVELGFGSGLNLPLLPKAVTRVNAVDPDRTGRRLAGARVSAASAEVCFAGLDGEKLLMDDASMDGALSTFTLCSIPDPVQAVREVRRVLRPGAPFVFLEHGIASTPRLVRWQRRINPVYSPIAGGCRLDLDVADVLARAGFTHVDVERSLLGKKPGLTNHLVRGVAYAP